MSTLRPLALSLSLLLASTLASGAAFTPNNVVVFRAGDGAGPLVNTGSPIFLDEYSIAPNGTSILVQSIPLPTATTDAARACISSGTATSEGPISRSTDGQYIAFSCYSRDLLPLGTSLAASTSLAVPRMAVRVGADGIANTTTALTDYSSGNNPRGVYTDGSGFWVVGGTGGVRYATLGASTSVDISTSITNMRSIDNIGGNLVVSHGSGVALGRLSQLTGLPTTGPQLMSSLNGFPTVAGSSPYAFVFVDLDATVGGVDTAYVVDDAADALQKWSLVSGTWTLTGSISAIVQPAGPLTNPRGLTGRFVQQLNGVALAIVADSNSIVVGIDTAGYNIAPNAQLATAVTAGVNTAFRGVAATPESAAPAENIFRNGFEDLPPPPLVNRILF
jgi:hypothetical protein